MSIITVSWTLVNSVICFRKQTSVLLFLIFWAICHLFFIRNILFISLLLTYSMCIHVFYNAFYGAPCKYTVSCYLKPFLHFSVTVRWPRHSHCLFHTFLVIHRKQHLFFILKFQIHFIPILSASVFLSHQNQRYPFLLFSKCKEFNLSIAFSSSDNIDSKYSY